jgi:hypothetical protein
MITPKKTAAIIERYHQLRNLAIRFVDQYDDGNKRGACNVQIEDNGCITYEKNTACHCHPEYETFTIASETFNEWLTKNQ